VVDNPLTSKAGMADLHQFHTRNDISERNERDHLRQKSAKITKPAFILPLITVWLQVRVLPASSEISGLLNRCFDHAPKNAHFRAVRQGP